MTPIKGTIESEHSNNYSRISQKPSSLPKIKLPKKIKKYPRI